MGVRWRARQRKRESGAAAKVWSNLRFQKLQVCRGEEVRTAESETSAKLSDYYIITPSESGHFSKIAFPNWLRLNWLAAIHSQLIASSQLTIESIPKVETHQRLYGFSIKVHTIPT